MVNDPYGFGRIAAANALSDVYAMGGEPLSAMNILCFPCKCAPAWVMRAILEGGRDAVAESGAVHAGGHSVDDEIVKYGLAVSGTVDPERMATNRGVRADDTLVLTKPLGTGVLANAILAEWDGYEEMERTLVAHCGRLNARAGSLIGALGLTGATDVTGFGLGGHLLELARASRVSMALELDGLPLLPGARELASMGLLPGGSIKNREHYLPYCAVPEGADPILVSLAFDAQTSGGLVLAIPGPKLAEALSRLNDLGEPCAVIGEARPPREDGKALAFF
jgi:selenide,water dikinase